MNSKSLIISLVFLIGLFTQSFGQKLRLPFRDTGACPFECCTYREWTANRNTVLFKAMTDSAPVSFRVVKSEKVQGLTGVVITTKPGIREALQNTYFEYYRANGGASAKIRVKKGERFSILTYLGEGVYKFWYKGKIYESHLEPPQFKRISDPVSVWWVKIKNRKNQIGWTRLSDNFDDQDACG